MLELLRSLSLFSGAIFCTIISIVVQFGYWKLTKSFNFLLVLFPIFLAGSIYWAPVWLGANPSGYWTWAPMMITIWGGPGALYGFLLFLSNSRKKK